MTFAAHHRHIEGITQIKAAMRGACKEINGSHEMFFKSSNSTLSCNSKRKRMSDRHRMKARV